MQWQDLVNGAYELFGAPFIFLSVLKLYRDKSIRGVDFHHVGYFTSWGIWNLYYYPHLDQWASFIGGIATTLVNSIWLGQILYYSRKENSNVRY
jgi:hypothetical protein